MTKSMKRIFLVLCSALCMVSMGIALVRMPKKTVHAAEAGDATTNYGLVLRDRVALRVYGSGGVRFSGSIPTANLSSVEEYGIILADEVTYHKNGELTYEKKNAVANNVDKTMKITTSGENTTFSVALYSIKEQNVARNYVARGYVKANGNYYYTDEVKTNPYELAKAAYTQNEITGNTVINDYLERVVDVTLDENNNVSANSPLTSLTTTTSTLSYEADQTLGWSGINKKVAALYVNGTKVAAAYTTLALSDWGTISVSMNDKSALLNVNGAHFENGKVIFDASSVLPEETQNWLSGVNAPSTTSTKVQYIQSAYSTSAQSFALNNGANVITLPATDYDGQIRSFGANYLRIRLAFSHVGQSLTVNGLNNSQNETLTASVAGENLLLTINKSGELYAMYTTTGKSVYLGNLPQSLFYGTSALSLSVENSVSGGSVELSPFFLSTSDEFNAVGDAVIGGGDLSIEAGNKAPEGNGSFEAAEDVFTHSLAGNNGYNAYVQKVNKDGATPVWKYWRILLDGYKYTDFSTVTFYLASNMTGYKYYNESGALLFTATQFDKVTIEKDGTVWHNGEKSANKLNNAEGKIVFHVETTATQHGATGNYYGEIHFSNFIVLDDVAVGTIAKDKISIKGITAVNDSSTTHPCAGGIEDTSDRIVFTGGYVGYVQDIKVDSGSQWHKYFKLTIDRDYSKYDSFSFYVTTNTKSNYGAMLLKVDGKIIGSVVANESKKITVMKDGLVLINDLSTGAYMKEGEIALYLDNNRTSAGYYGEIQVAKTAFVNGIVDTLNSSELQVVGVYDTPTYAVNANWGQGTNAGITDAIKEDLQQIQLDGTNTYWKYFRLNLAGINYENYNGVSFTIGNPRGMTFSVNGTQVADFYNKNQSVIKHTFTVNKDGSLWVDGVDTGVDYTGGEIYFDIVTAQTAHGNTSGNGYYGSFNIDPTITLNGGTNITLTTSNVDYYINLVGVAEPVVEEENEYETPQTDTVYTASYGVDGWNSNYLNGTNLLATYNQKATVNGTVVGWKYYRMTLDVDFRAADETVFYWVNNNGRQVATDIYLNGGKPLVSMYPQTAMKFTIDREGYVFINDDTVASGQIKTEKAIFYLNTNSTWHNNANDQYYGTLLLSNIWQDGKVVATVDTETYQTMYALVGVAESSFPAPTQYVVGAGDGFSFYQTANDTYNGTTIPIHSGDPQTAKTDGVNAVAHYAYRAIFDYYAFNYREYNATEFYLSSNRNNVEFFVNGVSLGKLATGSVCLKVKIDKQGYVYANDATVPATRISGKFIIDIQMPELLYNQFHISQQVWKDGTAVTFDKTKVQVWGIPAISTVELAPSAEAVESAPFQGSWEHRDNAELGINGTAYWADLDQKYDNAAISWRYWRFTMNLDYKTYESVSFYLGARLAAYDVYLYQTKIATAPAGKAVKITVDQFGNVYVGENLTDSVGKLIGENIVLDVDTHHSAHDTQEEKFYGYRLAVSETVTTNKGDILVFSNILSAVAVAQDVVIAPEYVEPTYTPNQGGGNFSASSDAAVKADTEFALDGYKTVLGAGWELYEVTVSGAGSGKVTVYLNASEAIEIYQNNALLSTLAANAWTPVIFDANGDVRFTVKIKTSEDVTLKTVAFAANGASKIDLEGKLSVKAAAITSILDGAWKEEGNAWTYDYQEIGKESTSERASLTLAYDYINYNKVSFTLTSNLGNVSVYASDKATEKLVTFKANVAVSFTVDKQGYVYVDGVQKGRLTTSTTTVYIGIDEKTTNADYDYYSVSVGKVVALAGNYSIVGDNEIGVGVTEDTLIANGASEYIILKGATDEYTNFAAQEVQTVLSGATGATLPVATMLTEETKDSKYILIGGNAIPVAVNVDSNPIETNFSGATTRDATAEEKKSMGITKVHSFTYTGWKHAWFDNNALTAYDEWIFYAKNDSVGKNLGFMANGGDGQNVITYLTNVEGWQEIRLMRNPNGQYGNNTYNVYYNGQLMWHPAVGEEGESGYIAPVIVEVDGNASKLAFNSPANGAAVSYTDLLAVQKTSVTGAEAMLGDTGNSGYALKTMDKNIYVLSNSTFGAMTGALDMLSYMVNYEAYAGDAVYYDSVSTLPVQAFDHTFKALIDERHFHEKATTDNDENRYRMKLQEQRDEWAAWVHTTVSQFLPVGTYGSHYSTSVTSNGITDVTLNSATLASKVGSPSVDTTYTFEYKKWLFSNYWYYGSTRGINLADYGITITGSPSQGDKITVSYSAASANHTDWYNTAGNQICYGTALGDLTSTDGMYQTFLTNVKMQLTNYFSQSQHAGKKSIYLSLGHEDNNMYCDCTKCTAIMNSFGGATGGGFAAIQLQFASKIAQDVNAWLPTAGLGDKDIKFVILAYGTAGRVVPTASMDDIHEDVYVMIAPIESFYNLDIYNEANSLVYDRLTDWSEYLSNNGRENGLVVYNYALNGMCYMFPTNNAAAGSYYEAFAANNVSYVYTQGAGATTASFEQLRIYVESKLMYDSKYSREELVKDFIMNYYDDAKNPTGSGEIMLKFYNQLENRYAELSRTTYDMYKDGTGSAEENGNGFNGYWHCDMFGPMDTSRSTGTAPTYWKTDVLKGYIELVGAAMTAIENSSLEQAVKDTLTKRVERERIFPLFVSVAMSYANYYDANDLNNSGTKDGFHDFDVKLTAEEKQSYVGWLKTLTDGWGMDRIYEASSLQWRNGLGIATNSVSEYLTTLENTGSKWYTKAD